ncbi:MAG: ATP-binding protein [Planctomycetota bacterium]
MKSKRPTHAPLRTPAEIPPDWTRQVSSRVIMVAFTIAALAYAGTIYHEYRNIDAAYRMAGQQLASLSAVALGDDSGELPNREIEFRLERICQDTPTIFEARVYRPQEPPLVVTSGSAAKTGQTFEAPLLTRPGIPPTGRVEIAFDELPFKASFQERAAWIALLFIGLFTLVAVCSSYFLNSALRRVSATFRKHVDRLSNAGKQSHPPASVGVPSDEFQLSLAKARNYVESLEDQVESYRHELSDLADTKTRFLANVSHEIRTPLAAIIGFVEMLDDDELSPERRRSYLETVSRNGRHLKLIVNDILDLSKIEAKGITIESLPILLHQLLGEIEKSMRNRALVKGLDFRFDIDAEVPTRIKGDPTRLRQVLDNLVGNAIKFTEQGFVGLRVSVVDRTADAALLSFEVRDSGIGLTAKQIAKIFEPFVQADSSVTRRYGGTGLGLAIAKQFAELMNGQLNVTSEAQQGAAFDLRIRVKTLSDAEDPKPSAKPPAPSPSSNPNLRFLIVEDSPDNQLLVRLLLKKEGIESDCADDGHLGIEKAVAAEAEGKPYDIILLDMQMPILDGYETVAELRRRALTSPVVALTAHAMVGDRERCLEAGCDEFLSKPLSRDQLLEIVEKLALGNNE